MTTFPNAKLSGLTVNLKTNVIKISAEIMLDPDALELAQTLEPFLLENAALVELKITPRQMPLKGMDVQVKQLS